VGSKDRVGSKEVHQAVGVGSKDRKEGNNMQVAPLFHSFIEMQDAMLHIFAEDHMNAPGVILFATIHSDEFMKIE
jgi:hypothetical protein